MARIVPDQTLYFLFRVAPRISRSNSKVVFMRAPNDLGGLAEGPIDQSPHQPSLFDTRVDALMMLLVSPPNRFFSVDAQRRTQEELPAETTGRATNLVQKPCLPCPNCGWAPRGACGIRNRTSRHRRNPGCRQHRRPALSGATDAADEHRRMVGEGPCQVSHTQQHDRRSTGARSCRHGLINPTSAPANLR